MSEGEKYRPPEISRKDPSEPNWMDDIVEVLPPANADVEMQEGMKTVEELVESFMGVFRKEWGGYENDQMRESYVDGCKVQADVEAQRVIVTAPGQGLHFEIFPHELPDNVTVRGDISLRYVLSPARKETALPANLHVDGRLTLGAAEALVDPNGLIAQDVTNFGGGRPDTSDEMRKKLHELMDEGKIGGLGLDGLS